LLACRASAAARARWARRALALNAAARDRHAGRDLARVILLAFPIAGLAGVPITPLVILACFLFEPLAGGCYALAGALISAAVTYVADRLLGRNLVRWLAANVALIVAAVAYVRRRFGGPA